MIKISSHALNLHDDDFFFFPDKAGGNKFSKDFEEGSMKLQEVVKFLEGQKEAGPALLEALGNADLFYEMQYKEVKIVANVSQFCCCDGYFGLGVTGLTTTNCQSIHLHP